MNESDRAVYDWYATSCPCGLPAGQCGVHPRARAGQRHPAAPWNIWVMLSGRGGGKSRAASEYILDSIARQVVPSVYIIVSRTIHDAVYAAYQDPNGLVSRSPPWNRARFIPSLAKVVFPCGSTVFLAGANNLDLVRGLRPSVIWGDHPESWSDPKAALASLYRMHGNLAGMKLIFTGGDPPAEFFDPFFSAGKFFPSSGVYVSRRSTFDNVANLNPDWVARMRERFSSPEHPQDTSDSVGSETWRDRPPLL